MRLICPNCDAQYEVDDSVIPPEGRDVQCSNCGHTWFQNSAAQEAAEAESAPPPGAEPVAWPRSADAAETAEPAAVAAAAAPEPQRRELDESVLSVLREEAELEQRARRDEASAETFEDQPDLGLDAGAEQRPTLQERMAKLRGIDTEPGTEAEETAEDAAAGSRRDLLPDIEEINSTLSASSDRGNLALADQDSDRPEGRSAFRRGFAMVVLLGAIGTGLYLYAPQIGGLHPVLEPIMNAYVGAIDTWRGWLNAVIPEKLNSMTRALTDAAN